MDLLGASLNTETPCVLTYEQGVTDYQKGYNHSVRGRLRRSCSVCDGSFLDERSKIQRHNETCKHKRALGKK